MIILRHNSSDVWMCTTSVPSNIVAKFCLPGSGGCRYLRLTCALGTGDQCLPGVAHLEDGRRLDVVPFLERERVNAAVEMIPKYQHDDGTLKSVPDVTAICSSWTVFVLQRKMGIIPNFTPS